MPTVGNQVLYAGQQNTIERVDRSGALVTTDGHARYAEAVLQGRVFTAAASAIAVTTVGATTYTGFVLTNPVGSGVNAALISLQFAQTSTAAATAQALVVLGAQTFSGTSVVTHTTAVTPRSTFLGSTATPSCLADSGATVPTAATLIRTIWQPSVSATATTAIPPMVHHEIAGEIVLQPGSYVLLGAASALSGSTTMTWEELAI